MPGSSVVGGQLGSRVVAESRAPFPQAAGPGLERRALGGSRLSMASQLNILRVFLFFFVFVVFFSLPRQSTVEADTFHVAGFWPDDV